MATNKPSRKKKMVPVYKMAKGGPAKMAMLDDDPYAPAGSFNDKTGFQLGPGALSQMKAQYDADQARTAGLNIPTTLATPNFSNAFKPPAGPAAAAQEPSWQSQVSAGLDNVVPYVSNIANSFRRPPSPAVPRGYDPVHLQRVNYGADRAEIDRTIAGQNQGLGALGENQATAVRTANLVQGIRGKNQVSQAEANQNAQISNQEIGMNSQIARGNIDNMNQYEDQRVNMRMAQQGQQSANLANAADKYVGMRNQQAMRNVERDKFNILSKVYANSGVVDRTNLVYNEKTGQMEPRKLSKGGDLKYRAGGKLGYKAGGMMKVYAYGGMPDPDPTKPVIPVNMNDPMARINAAGGHYYAGANAQVPQSMSMERSRSGDVNIPDPRTVALEAQRIRAEATRSNWAAQNPGADPNLRAAQIRNTQGTINPQTGDWVPGTAYKQPGRVVNPSYNSLKVPTIRYTKGGTMRKVYR